MILRSLAVLTGIIVLYTSYRIAQEPVPVECTEPLKIKILGFVYKLVGHIGTSLEMLGITTDEAAKKALVSTTLAHRPIEGVTIVDTVFDGIDVRIYTPTGTRAGTRDTLPGMVYYHGGGWTVGSIVSHHPVTAYFSKEVNMVVVSVEYRLAPKNTQADGLDDCIKATKFFIKNADKFNVDAKRVVVAGDSAGGNFAATVSLRFRDEGFKPMPKIQLLIYPALQGIAYDLPSYQQNARGPLLDRHELMWFKSYVMNKNRDLIPKFLSNMHVPRNVRQELSEGVLNIDHLPKELLYAPYKPPVFPEGDAELWDQIKERCFDPYHNPLMAKDHSNLPEAYIFTAMYDQLRDEGFFYAKKLQDAGVKVTHYNCPYCWHGMVNFWTDIKDSERIMSEMASFIRINL